MIICNLSLRSTIKIFKQSAKLAITIALLQSADLKLVSEIIISHHILTPTPVSLPQRLLNQVRYLDAFCDIGVQVHEVVEQAVA